MGARITELMCDMAHDAKLAVNYVVFYNPREARSSTQHKKGYRK